MSKLKWALINTKAEITKKNQKFCFEKTHFFAKKIFTVFILHIKKFVNLSTLLYNIGCCVEKKNIYRVLWLSFFI